MDWFGGSAFGLFVHWGPYSAQGWEASWPMVGGVSTLPNCIDVPVEHYHRRAKEWRPDPEAPERWVRAAASAGMRYAVLTTRHHDGYALWPSAAGKAGSDTDLVGPFVRACRRHGLKAGLYYSLPDWGHEDYPAFEERHKPYVFGAYPAADREGWRRFQLYLKEQLRELLTSYGRIDLLWFDGAWERTPEEWDAAGLRDMIRILQPEIVINDRLPGAANYRVCEQFIPAEPIGEPWEASMTMNQSWAFDPQDQDYKSPAEIVHALCETVARGGNLLLNVGPDGTGHLPPEEARRLGEVGGWVQRNGEALFGAAPGFAPWQFYGPSTAKGGAVYCHLLMRPVAPVIIRGIRPRHVTTITVLGSERSLPFGRRLSVLDELEGTDAPGEISVDIPEDLVDPFATIIKVEFDRNHDPLQS